MELFGINRSIKLHFNFTVSFLLYANRESSFVLWISWGHICSHKELTTPRCMWNVVKAEWSKKMDSGSVIYRMWVLILAWSAMTLVCLSKALNHNISSPRSTTGYCQSWKATCDGLTGVLSRGNRNILSILCQKCHNTNHYDNTDNLP